MIAVSGRWAGAHRTNHQPIHRVEVWKTTTKLISDLRVEEARITKDAGSVPRTTATVTVADLSPDTARLLTPFGSRLKFYAGIKYPDATTELVLVADLDIIASRLSKPAGTLTLDCADPSALISAQSTSGPLRPLHPATGTVAVIESITWILAHIAYYHGTHTLSVIGSPADANLPADYNIDGDPWDAIEQMADSIGCECFFTPARVPVLRTTPDMAGAAVAALYTGAGGSVTVLDSAITRAPNILYLYGAADAAGVARRGYASDTDTSSPTYPHSAYGRVMARETRAAVFGSIAAANEAAMKLFTRMQGRVRTVELDAVTDPALEPGDTVGIRFTGGTVERHLLQSVDIPLGVDEMHVTTRTTAYTTAGWP